MGINLTHMAYRFLSEGAAKSHFYNAAALAASNSSSSSDPRPTLENFHHFYSYLFVEFDKFWYAYAYTCFPIDLFHMS